MIDDQAPTEGSVFGVLSALFAQCLLMFLISFFFFLLTHRSNPGGRFFAWELCACVCVCTSVAANKHTWQQKTIRLLEEEKKGGLILTDCHRKIPVKTTFVFCFFFVFFIFSGSHFASRARACHCPSSKICGWHWPGFIFFVLLFPRHQQQRSVLLAPSHNTVQ